MSKDLTIQKTELITPELIKEYLDAFGMTSQLEEPEKNQFIQVACAFQLNPLKREVYCVPFNDYKSGKRKLSIVVGYEVYVKRAERSGQLSGWRVWTEDNNKKAIIEINRKDWKTPLRHEVFFDEYSQENRMWKSKPVTMLKKVAIAQGFRLAFPCECGGMPYTSDEMPTSDEQQNKIEEVDQVLEPVNLAVTAAEEVKKEVKKSEDIFNNALNVIPKAHNADLLAEMQRRIDQRFTEGLLSEDQVSFLNTKIKERLDFLMAKEFKE